MHWIDPNCLPESSHGEVEGGWAGPPQSEARADAQAQGPDQAHDKPKQKRHHEDEFARSGAADA